MGLFRLRKWPPAAHSKKTRMLFPKSIKFLNELKGSFEGFPFLEGFKRGKEREQWNGRKQERTKRESNKERIIKDRENEGSTVTEYEIT